MTTVKYRAYKFFHVILEEALALLNEGVQSGVGPSRIIDEASKMLDFDLLDNRTEYLAGVDLAAFQGKPKRWGASMLDAFKPFEAGLRDRYQGRLRLWRDYAVATLESNAVTFGSPNSNMLAREIFCVDVDEEDRFIPRPDTPTPPLTFENPSPDLVQRTSGYTESSRLIRLANGRTYAPRVKDGALVDDYLIISCVPHPRAHVEKMRVLDARIAAYEKQLESGSLSNADFEECKIAREMRAAIRVNRILCIGGIYGPGTGAAGLIFSDRRRVRELKAAVEGMPSFHAIYHIERIRTAKLQGNTRELPAEISLAPIEVLPGD